MAERIIRTLHASLSDGREVTQGETVDLPAEDEARLDELGSLVPPGFGSWDEFHSHMQDAYRSGRGDTEASARVAAKLAQAREGGIEDIDRPSATLSESEGDVEQYATWMRDENPSNDAVVEMAHDDPERARRLLEAENLVSGQKPRKGVVDGLTKIIDSGAE